METLAQAKGGKTPPQIVIVLDWRAIIALFALALVLGRVDDYRRGGELMHVEAQNARILELLEGSEITRVSWTFTRLNQP